MRGTPVRFVDFRGGVNTKASPYLVDQKEARDARNVVSTTRGSVRKRDGCQTHAAPAFEVMSLFAADALASPVLLGVMSNNHLVSIGSTGTVTTIGSFVTAGNNIVSFVQAPVQGTQGPVYYTNGVDIPGTWAGGANTAGWTLASGAIPNAKLLAYHGNRVFMADLSGGTGLFGTVSDPGSALCFTDIGNPCSMPASNIVLFDPNDGDQITGLGKVGPYLLVFKRRKTFVVYDSDTGANRRIADNVGCAAARSIAESPHGTYFLTADRGIYRTNGTSVDLVSDNVAPTLRDIPSGQRSLSAGTYYNDHYYLSVASGSANLNTTLDYDSTIDSWWMHSFAANQWAVIRFTGLSELFAANAGAALASRCFVPGVTQDNNINFTAYWKGPWQAFGAPYLRKRLRQVHLDGTGPFDVFINKDFEPGDTLAKSSACAQAVMTTFGGVGNYGDFMFGDTANNTQEDRVLTPGVGRAWSVGFQATSATAMEIDSYTMAYTGRRN